MGSFSSDLVLNAIQRQTGKSLPDIVSAFKKFLPRIEAARPASKVQSAAPQPQVLRAAPEPEAPAVPSPVMPAGPRGPAGRGPVGPVAPGAGQPAVPTPEVQGQLRLPLTSRGEGGRLVSIYGRGTVDPDVVRASLAADALPPVRIEDPFGSAFGRQLDLPLTFRREVPVPVTSTFTRPGASSSIEAMSSPLRSASEMDLGTASSIRQLAEGLSRRTGVPADEIFTRVTQQGGTDYLNELASRNALTNLSNRLGLEPLSQTQKNVLLGLAGAGTLTAAVNQGANQREQAREAARLRQAATIQPAASVQPGAYELSEQEQNAAFERILQKARAGETPEEVTREVVEQVYEDPSGQTVIKTGEAVFAPSPDEAKTLSEYYRQRGAYTAQADVAEKLVEDFITRGGFQGEQKSAMTKWAEANPHLVYEMKRRSMVDPNQSLQSGENVSSETIGTELGSDSLNSAAGSAQAISDAAVSPTAGGMDMVAATRPLKSNVLLNKGQARNYAEESIEAAPTFTDKLLMMAAARRTA